MAHLIRALVLVMIALPDLSPAKDDRISIVERSERVKAINVLCSKLSEANAKSKKLSSREEAIIPLCYTGFLPTEGYLFVQDLAREEYVSNCKADRAVLYSSYDRKASYFELSDLHESLDIPINDRAKERLLNPKVRTAPKTVK